jgi:hypothetical protein
MRLIACALCCASAGAALTGASDAGSRPNTGPWDLDSLQKAPEFTVADRDGNLASIYYTGEPYHGKPTRVFAYLAGLPPKYVPHVKWDPVPAPVGAKATP